MNFNIGDYVSRNSYNNDIVFQIIDIDGDVAILYGVDVRLCADSLINDLKLEKNIKNENDEELLNRFDEVGLNRNQYFYLPGKIVHLDGCNTLCKSNKTLIK